MQVKHKGKYRILCPGSDLGMLQIAEKVREALRVLRNQGHRHICVDLNNAPVIDSSVIGVLVRFHQELEKDKGELIIISERNPAVEAMISMHLGRVIRFIQTESELD